MPTRSVLLCAFLAVAAAAAQAESPRRRILPSGPPQCPDATCAELPLPSGPECQCPGPGCPEGGWLAYPSGDAKNDSKVAFCHQRAQEMRKENMDKCRVSGHCRGAAESPRCADPACHLIPMPVSENCPCPGPGCPDGGWEANREAIIVDPKASFCYDMAVAQKEKNLEQCRAVGHCRPPEERAEDECACPGAGCPELEDPKPVEIKSAYIRCRARAEQAKRQAENARAAAAGAAPPP